MDPAYSIWVPRWVAVIQTQAEVSSAMQNISISLNLAKHVLEIHATDTAGAGATLLMTRHVVYGKMRDAPVNACKLVVMLSE